MRNSAQFIERRVVVVAPCGLVTLVEATVGTRVGALVAWALVGKVGVALGDRGRVTVGEATVGEAGAGVTVGAGRVAVGEGRGTVGVGVGGVVERHPPLTRLNMINITTNLLSQCWGTMFTFPILIYVI